MNNYTKKRKIRSVLLRGITTIFALGTIVILLAILGYIFINGIPNLSLSIFSPEYTSENLSMLPAIINTLIITGLSLLLAVPIGIFSAIYLVEYANPENKLIELLRLAAETLSGIPSIVYGLFGFIVFSIYLNLCYSFLGGAITMAIMILPLIMRSAEEALKSVPSAYREGSFSLGAGRLRTVLSIVLPVARPGILAGIILGIGRVVGETAALMYTAGTAAVIPKTVFDSGRTLSVHMYSLLSEGLHTEEAYATAVILIITVLGINFLSAVIAKKLQKGYTE